VSFWYWDVALVVTDLMNKEEVVGICDVAIDGPGCNAPIGLEGCRGTFEPAEVCIIGVVAGI